ncbi:MAG: nicotinate phosphoribosyltransferase [Acidimicrobiales bacterium]
MLDVTPGDQRWTPTGLLTDHYELTMLDAALRSGVAQHRATFECFPRRLPPGRRYGVMAGVGRLVEALHVFRFDDGALTWLSQQGFLSARALQWLADYRFTGTVRGYLEGELFFPGSPILTVEGTFGEAVILETLVLSILNHDCAVAAAGARMVAAAAGRPLLEAGSRRTAEYAAPAAARAAYLVGFAATSNLEAGRRWGVPTGGTVAHAFVLAHRDERAAFEAQLALTGPDTTMLVDTFDIETGIRNAVDVAGPSLGAIRIDSGDPLVESRRARALLDGLGASATRIVVSGDLDEWAIAELVRAQAPVDRMLIGTHLVTGSGAPAAGLVYKLVAMAEGPGADAPLRPVAKTSPGKASIGGAKLAARRLGPDGRALAELVTLAPLAPSGDAFPPAWPGGDRSLLRALQRTFVLHGDPVDGTVDGTVADLSLGAARAHHRMAMAELSDEQRSLAPGDAALRAVPA